MTPQVKTKQNLSGTSEFCSAVFRSFFWFSGEFVPKIEEISQKFWNADLRFKLFAVTEKPEYYWKDNDYFVTQIGIIDGVTSFVRISESSVKLLLNLAFDGQLYGEKNLKLADITELEAKIIISYNRLVQKSLREFFISNKKLLKLAPYEEWRDDFYHFTFFMSCPEQEHSNGGKFIVSIPKKVLISPISIPPPEELLLPDQFNNSQTAVNISVGSTRLTLSEVKNLEEEDIIILENSNIHNLSITGDLKIDFNINPNPRIVINVNDNNEGEVDVNQDVNKETGSISDIWDNIQIDVNAEFEKIKISLGELRQISEGLVVDLASIYDNEILLSVENKPVAVGELVIVGDRYGVKLTKVFRLEKTEEIEQLPLNEEVQDAEVESEETGEFDYNDFEIDDDI